LRFVSQRVRAALSLFASRVKLGFPTRATAASTSTNGLSKSRARTSRAKVAGRTRQCGLRDLAGLDEFHDEFGTGLAAELVAASI